MIKKVSILKKVLFAFFVIFSINFICCRVGLDEEVDLEAPVLTLKNLQSGDTTLESFNGGVYCKKDVTFSGTATDNNKISRVYVELKWSTENSFVEIGEANISGSNWTFSYTFENEGSCYIRFSAEDPAKNYSTKTSKTITLFVDETAPVANAWYIDREINGIQYNLKTKEELESLDLTLPENKDAAQNSSFTLCATANDTFGIKDISVTIKDENGNTVTTVENSNTDNNYAPKFKITNDILVSGDESLASGKHYLQVFYNAEDIVEFPSSNVSSDVEVSIGYFLWWPESDIPQIVSSEIESDEDSGELSLNAYVKDAINLTFFDDDELSDGYFALLTGTEYSSFTIDWDSIKDNPELIINAVKADSANNETTDEEARENRTYHFKASSGEREASIVLNASAQPQTMHLLAIGWDNTNAKQLVTKSVVVRVTDDSTPILLISSPKTNSIPTVDSEGVFTVEGTTLDSAGCSYLEFVWVPNSLENKYTLAKSWLDTIVSDDSHTTLAKAKNRITTNNGLKLWSVELSDDGTLNGFYKNSFSFDIDLLNDFTYNGTNEQALSKYFLIKLTRKDGNSILQEYTLAEDNVAPTIVSVTPASDMQIVLEDSDLTLKYYATKSSELAINPSAYKIERIDVSPSVVISDSVDGYSNVGYDSTSGYYKATISSDTLKEFNTAGTKPKYRFYAADIFGNEGYEQYTIVISDLPALKTISSPNATSYKKGETIDIIATFSKTVGITGTPKLKLKGITNSTTETSAPDYIYATYSSGSGTTAIHFAYTVQDGDFSSGLTLYDDTTGATTLVDDDYGSLSSANVIITNSFTNSFDSQNIQVDGISPTATTVAFTTTSETTTSGIMYVKSGGSITATLTISESVLVASPAPSITLTSSSSSITLPFTNSTGSGSSTKLTFSKTISSSDVNGLLYYDLSSYLVNASSITDSFGNEFELSSTSTSTSSAIYVDTVAPKTPTSTLTSDTKGKNSVSFTLTKAETDETIQYLQYSKDGGSTWNNSSEGADSFTASLTETCSFTYRAIDYAGNISDIPDAIYVEVENNFPSFTVECTNADGNYKAGSELILRVSFSRAVNVPTNCGATITVSDASGSGQGGGNAVVSSASAQTSVYSVDFTYTVQTTDDFTLKVATDAITLTGITDEYGNTQSGKILESDYERTDIHCDGIAPTVTVMTPSGATSTSGVYDYTKANEITLTFSENVIKSSGNITLRRAGTWAIPSVLSASDFNKIVSAYPAGKETLSLQENGSDMEDSEWVNGSNDGYENKYYHGTGQFVGPYKKMSQGILDTGEPDTSTKYVLDFDMDIWDTDTVHYYGKTFTPSSSSGKITVYSAKSLGYINMYVWDTADSSINQKHIAMSESGDDYVGTINVTSCKIILTKQNNGWNGQTGNLEIFSAGNWRFDGSSFSTDSQTSPTTLTSSNATKITVGDIRSVLENAGYHERVLDVTSSAVKVTNNTVIITFPKGLCDTDASLPKGIKWEVIVDAGAFMDESGNDINSYTSSTFFSSGVQTPVIRVDRYSYGLGIYQSDSSGSKSIIASGTKPNGCVRTRIDCQTPDVTIKYSKNNVSTNSSSSGSYTKRDATSYYYESEPITISDLSGSSYTPSTEYNSVFASGSGSYNTACRQYIVANATHSSLGTSENGYEGIFQTVVHFVSPKASDNSTPIANSSYSDFSIRGTTGWGGEPSISPFPLRDAQIGSPYLRLCYKDGNDYYWVSYEILTDSAYSGYGNKLTSGVYWRYFYGWGWVTPGGLSDCSGMHPDAN